MDPNRTPPNTQSPSTTLEPIVHSLVQKYQSVEILHPFLQTLFESGPQKTLFTTVAQHDYDVLKSRSQNLADHEISSYQKAFCILMENEDDRIGGLEIYVEKILGIDEVGKGDKEEWLPKGVAVRALLAHVTQPPPPPTPTNPNPKHHPLTDPTSKPRPTHPLDTNTNTNTNTQTKLSKLYSVYQSARHDFLSTPTSSSPTSLAGKTKAAKFLRDTVENCMEYLKTQQGAGGEGEGEGEGEGGRRGEMMAELGASLRVAKQVAEEGSGGRKRRFDLGMWQGVPQGPKRVREGSGQRGSEHAVRGGGGRGGRGGGVRGGRIGIRSPHPLRLAPVQSQREVVRRRVDMADADVWRPSYK